MEEAIWISTKIHVTRRNWVCKPISVAAVLARREGVEPVWRGLQAIRFAQFLPGVFSVRLQTFS